MSSESAIKHYSFFLFLLFLCTMGCWIVWNHKPVVMNLLGISLYICSQTSGIKLEMTRQNLFLCLVLYLSYLIVDLNFSVRVLLTQIISYLLPVICVICVSPEVKRQALSYITKWFAYLMIPSFVVYLLSYGMNSSLFGMVSPDMDTYGQYANFLIYVRPLRFSGSFLRFSGPFIEPGHLGMMCAFLLFANLFDFKKKEVVIIAITLLITLSLAGYVLAVIGFLFVRYYQGRIRVRNLIVYMAFLGCFYFIGHYYNGGDNLINERILSRLELDEEVGIIGNNRTSLNVMAYYADMLNDPMLLLKGYSIEEQEAMGEQLHGTGFQYFLVRNGLINLFLAFLFYLFVAFYAKDKKYAFLFLLFVGLCFLQRTYPFWISWIICYEYAIRSRDAEA